MSTGSSCIPRDRTYRRKALALAICGSISLFFAGGVLAQATTGTIRGAVPVAPNETIRITGGAGFERTLPVGSSGSYSITLPVGTYTVTLLQNGIPVQSRKGVSPAAAGSVTIDFGKTETSSANARTLQAINVTASAIPTIDVSTTSPVTTVTSAELKRIPLGRNASGIAMLAPGVAEGAPTLGSGALGNPLLTFGGASVAENAQYVDGMNATNQVTGQGGVELPYGAIEQQQTMATGYDARYGRSIGGVINQIGKAGSNDWHFGFKALWEPASLGEGGTNDLWSNPLYKGPNANQTAGNLEQYNAENTRQEAVYDAYVSGPIIKNRLTFFLAAEQDNISGQTTGPVTSSFTNRFHEHKPKVYAKVNWNINRNNIFSLSYLQNSTKIWPANYDFDYAKLSTGGFSSFPLASKNTFRLWVAHYTSYLTDNLTLHAMFGKVHAGFPLIARAYPGFSPDLPGISNASLQNPALIPNGPVSNPQTDQGISDPQHQSRSTNYRVDLEYTWNNHDFRVGIDNLQTLDVNDGFVIAGPGYVWSYGQGDPDTPIIGEKPTVPPYVAPPDSNGPNPGGYYVRKGFNNLVGTTRVTQRAQYLEDRWQVTPRLLLDLGIRNDQFINYSAAGGAYIRLTKPQWAPRLGFSWDVYGDATLKVFGNAGRYYLALPAAVGFNGTAAALQSGQYFTYSGIDQATGVPLNVEPIAENNGGRPAELGVSGFNAYGQPVNPKTVAAQNIKAEYSDNYVLGFQQSFHMLGSKYVFGADGTYQKMGPDIVDDWDDGGAMCQAAIAQGVDYVGATMDEKLTSCSVVAPPLVLINPTQTEDILMSDSSGVLHTVTVTPQDQDFPRPVTRKYYAINLSLTHPFDGKWFGKIVYTWSRSYGNTEGPVDTATGQAGGEVGLTIQWDYWQFMQNAYGLLPGNHTNALKAYGFYQVSPDWRVGGNLYVSSGRPTNCMGLFGPDETDPAGYGAYHWCGGQPSPPGSLGSTPWLKDLDLSVNYSPAWMAHRWNFNLSVFNVFNSQAPTQLSNSFGSSFAPDPTYLLPVARMPPRTVRFYVSFDF